jgi:hypothetical protein
MRLAGCMTVHPPGIQGESASYTHALAGFFVSNFLEFF